MRAEGEQVARTPSVKSLATQEWIVRVLEDGPLSAREISHQMFLEQWEQWAEEEGVGGLIEWGNRESEPLAARLLAWGRAKDRGLPALHSWQLRPHLIRMERAGVVERIGLPGHRPMLWRTAPQPPLARDPEWPPSECVCAETSTRNCPVHQNAGDPEWSVQE